MSYPWAALTVAAFNRELRAQDESTLPRELPTMNKDLFRLCFLSTAVALSSAACTSSIGSGATSSGATSSGSGGSGGSGTSSGSGTGSGGGACQPAMLVGANSTAGAWRMAALDPATGTVTTLSPLASVAGFLQGDSAYDPATKQI